MSTLTDRMAVALRRVIDDVSDLSNETLAVCHEVLAEYDAARNPPRPVKICAGSTVRCTRASKKTRDYQQGDEAQVQYLLAEKSVAVVNWLTDLGSNHGVPRSSFLPVSHCEVIK